VYLDHRYIRERTSRGPSGASETLPSLAEGQDLVVGFRYRSQRSVDRSDEGDPFMIASSVIFDPLTPIPWTGYAAYPETPGHKQSTLSLHHKPVSDAIAQTCLQTLLSFEAIS
jgi:hypothetical protein